MLAAIINPGITTKGPIKVPMFDIERISRGSVGCNGVPLACGGGLCGRLGACDGLDCSFLKR